MSILGVVVPIPCCAMGVVAPKLPEEPKNNKK